jgi:hypothetical protein
LGNATLREQYSALYNIIHHKGDTLAKMLDSSPSNVAFKIYLVGPRLTSCFAIAFVFGSVDASD